VSSSHFWYSGSIKSDREKFSKWLKLKLLARDFFHSRISQFLYCDIFLPALTSHMEGEVTLETAIGYFHIIIFDSQESSLGESHFRTLISLRGENNSLLDFSWFTLEREALQMQNIWKFISSEDRLREKD
jgi:hypothetical protein